MQYNSNADSQDLVSEVLRICNTSTGDYTLKDITRRVNAGLDRYFELAFEAAGNGSVDDYNQSTAPIDTVNLVSGTNAYKLSDFTANLFNVLKFEVKDSSGVWHELVRETFETLPGAFGELYSTSVVGVPAYFLKLGDFIYLRNTPNYTSSGGLRAFFERETGYIASTATTLVPGIPANHHWFLARYAAQPYLEENGKTNVKTNYTHIQEDEDKIRKYYARINQVNRRLRPLIDSNR